MTTDARPSHLPIHLRRFTALPEAERNNKVRPLSARLATGRWQEHREAAEFIDGYCSGHGDAIDTLVRALLHYRDHLRSEGLLEPAVAEPRLFAAPATAPRRTGARRSTTGAAARRARPS